jgi:hypothetical protein
MTKIIDNVFNHFSTICTHKKWVAYYCFKFGIPFRGIFHDLSKFSPTEFIESVKYYTGYRSPIDLCKEKNGVSKAWLHHKGRNRHHYEYWQDNFDKGGTPLQMPRNDAIEMLADYLGAARAYMGNEFSYADEYKWWKNKISKGIAMHPQTKKFIDNALHLFKEIESKNNNVAKYLTPSVIDSCYSNATYWYLGLQSDINKDKS